MFPHVTTNMEDSGSRSANHRTMRLAWSHAQTATGRCSLSSAQGSTDRLRQNSSSDTQADFKKRFLRRLMRRLL